mgnify:CR=1 FL=1
MKCFPANENQLFYMEVWYYINIIFILIQTCKVDLTQGLLCDHACRIRISNVNLTISNCN